MSYLAAIADFFSAYRLVPSTARSDLKINSLATIFWVVLKKNLSGLTASGRKVIIDPYREQSKEIFRAIRNKDTTIDALMRMRPTTNFGVQSQAWDDAQSELYALNFQDIFETFGDNAILGYEKNLPNYLKDNYLFLIKGITANNIHVSIEDENNASFTMPNPGGLLYDGAGRLLINPCDEVTILTYDNYTGSIITAFYGLIMDPVDIYDGQFYNISINVKDFTWFLHKYQMNLSPGLSHIERMFGYDVIDKINPADIKSTFMDGLIPSLTRRAVFTAGDWGNYSSADNIFPRPVSSFGGLDISSVASLVLCGVNYFDEFGMNVIPDPSVIESLIRENILSSSEMDALSEQVTGGQVKSFSTISNEGKINYFAELKVKKEQVEAAAEAMGLTIKPPNTKGAKKTPDRFGLGFMLKASWNLTYAGRNLDKLTNFDKAYFQNKTGRVPAGQDGLMSSLSVDLNAVLFDAFSKVVRDKAIFYNSFKDKTLLEQTDDRFEKRSLIVEPEVQQQQGYKMLFDNFKATWESDYQSIYDFIHTTAENAGLLFYCDEEGNFRLETLHCNDFPSAVIDEHEIQGWSFSEDCESYVSRVDATVLPSVATEAYSGIERYMWAMCVDFDLLERYGYRMETHELTMAIPELSDGVGTMGFALASAAIMSRRLMDMENGKILGGSLTMHPNPLIKVNSTVYIPMRNMIYTVMSIDYSKNEQDGSDEMDLRLSYGRQPGFFYEGLLYGIDALSYPVLEVYRLAAVRKVRTAEWNLWAKTDLYDSIDRNFLKTLIKDSESQTDANIYKTIFIGDAKEQARISALNGYIAYSVEKSKKASMVIPGRTA